MTTEKYYIFQPVIVIKVKDPYMLQVEVKDNESLESLIRRFNKKVTQAGLLSSARRRKYFEKPLSKREARAIAIRKAARKELKQREFMTIRG